MVAKEYHKICTDLGVAIIPIPSDIPDWFIKLKYGLVKRLEMLGFKLKMKHPTDRSLYCSYSTKWAGINLHNDKIYMLPPFTDICPDEDIIIAVIIECMKPKLIEATFEPGPVILGRATFTNLPQFSKYATKTNIGVFEVKEIVGMRNGRICDASDINSEPYYVIYRKLYDDSIVIYYNDEHCFIDNCGNKAAQLTNEDREIIEILIKEFNERLTSC